jgi:hypothetical protein
MTKESKPNFEKMNTKEIKTYYLDLAKVKIEKAKRREIQKAKQLRKDLDHEKYVYVGELIKQKRVLENLNDVILKADEKAKPVLENFKKHIEENKK